MVNKLEYVESDLSERQTDIYTLPDLHVDILHPERILLELMVAGKTIPIDLGSLCFLKRERLLETPLRIMGRADYVLLSSFRLERRELVLSIIDHLLTSGLRNSSIDALFKGIRGSINWYDLNGHENFFLSREKARHAYKGYSDYLHYLILVKNVISTKTASAKQGFARRLISALFDSDDTAYITRSTPPFSFQKSSNEAPKKLTVSKYFNTCTLLATQVSKFLVEVKPYPLPLNMVGYSTYIFPSKNGANIKTPYTVQHHKVFNFEEGRIATQEEYLKLIKNPYMNPSRNPIVNAKKTMEISNKDSHNEYRITLVTLALQAYAALFIMITGTNPTQFTALEYDEAVELVNSPVKKELTTIKMRAQGKIIRIIIGGKKGLNLLKEYLKFRDWLLNGEHCKWLFFRLESFSRAPKKLLPDFQSNFFEARLKGTYLPKTFKNISPTAARKYKSASMHTLKINPRVVADVHGHTTTTNVKHYADEPTLGQSENDFSKYWDTVMKKAEAIRVKDPNKDKSSSSTTVGHCDSFNNPTSQSDSPPIEPNCNTQYGCLYCKHYICHSDEKDVLKLLSLKYVMIEVRQQSDNYEQTDKLLKELCVRVSVIIDTIKSKSKDHEKMVTSTERKVFKQGLLTPFWEARMTRYEQMGVII